jgi:hypothetical protein
MKLYKFRPLLTCCNYDRVISIIRDGFYCCSFLDFNDVNEGVFPVSKKTQSVDLNQKLEYRICSFSKEKALSSQLMWGHYAEAGMGVAIEILAAPVSPFEKVNYDQTDRHNSLKEILTNKSAQWKHEEEWRYLSTTQDNYYKTKITKIYFGAPYQHLTNYEEIKAKHHKLREYHRRLEMLKAECDNRKIGYDIYQLA